jgi:hypothetical protein
MRKAIIQPQLAMPEKHCGHVSKHKNSLSVTTLDKKNHFVDS